MILYHYTTPQNLLLVSWSGLKPKGETITGGRPVVWLTTQETAVLREADVAHIKSCLNASRIGAGKAVSRKPEHRTGPIEPSASPSSYSATIGDLFAMSIFCAGSVAKSMREDLSRNSRHRRGECGGFISARSRHASCRPSLSRKAASVCKFKLCCTATKATSVCSRQCAMRTQVGLLLGT